MSETTLDSWQGAGAFAQPKIVTNFLNLKRFNIFRENKQKNLIAKEASTQYSFQ